MLCNGKARRFDVELFKPCFEIKTPRPNVDKQETVSSWCQFFSQVIGKVLSTRHDVRLSLYSSVKAKTRVWDHIVGHVPKGRFDIINSSGASISHIVMTFPFQPQAIVSCFILYSQQGPLEFAGLLKLITPFSLLRSAGPPHCGCDPPQRMLPQMPSIHMWT